MGLFSVYSASAPEALATSQNSLAIVLKQSVWMVLGLVAMLAVGRFPFPSWARLAHPMACIAIALLGLTLVTGQVVNGSERWLMLPGGIQFQPSDLAKLSAVLLLAQVTSQRSLMRSKLLPLNMGLIMVMVFLIYQQPNLSIAVILSLLSAVMLFVGGFSLPVLSFVVPIIGFGVYQKILDTPYQLRRINGWLNPWADPQDSGYNLIQSLYALGGGQWFGLGYGHSIQKRHYLPFPYTDFIFSVICEEWGFIGGVLLLFAIAFLAWRGYHIATQCTHPFGQMLAFGITTQLVLQSFINVGVATGLLPVTGVTLPFISYGGTSLVVTLVMVGILLNISRSIAPSASPLRINTPTLQPAV